MRLNDDVASSSRWSKSTCDLKMGITRIRGSSNSTASSQRWRGGHLNVRWQAGQSFNMPADKLVWPYVGWVKTNTTLKTSILKSLQYENVHHLNIRFRCWVWVIYQLNFEALHLLYFCCFFGCICGKVSYLGCESRFHYLHFMHEYLSAFIVCLFNYFIYVIFL